MMTKYVYPPGEYRMKYPIFSSFKHLLFATALGLGVGLGTDAATAGTSPGQPVLTKSGQIEAIKDAAAAVRQGALPAEQIGAKVAALGADAAPTTAGVPPASPVDQTKIPHYFGPFPNWAMSPFTLPDVVVEIAGNGQGAKATAHVGLEGEITGITLDEPGNGYTSATVTIKRASDGSDGGARAYARTTSAVAVTSINVDTGGAGYTAPQVIISGGGVTANNSATATAYGSVDAIQVTSGGVGYTRPTVSVDLPDDPNGVLARARAVCDRDPVAPCGTVGPGTITSIIVTSPGGSGYSVAPGITIRDGTIEDPVRNRPGSGATAKATLTINKIVLNTYGNRYRTVPTVAITDTPPGGIGTGATATASINKGSLTGIYLTNNGSGYITKGIKKFVDTLPMLCNPALANCNDPSSPATNNLGQSLPLAVPDTTTFPGSDYYVIALVEYRQQMSSSLPAAGTLLRGYVQLKTPAQSGIPGVELGIDLPGVGGPAIGVTKPQFLGPVIAATKDRAVRIKFYNLLPKDAGGDLFLPTDSTLMGSGIIGDWEPQNLGTVLDEVRNPDCTVDPQSADPKCFKQNRATLHLHGGLNPWISDGTPHQWITPADETTIYPQGDSVGNVPDMNAPDPKDVGCGGETDGCSTFYYTNQQSARLMFYHDHAWGITRLGVYVGGAAGYLISDDTEQALIANGTIPADQIPLIIQDRTFVPEPVQLSEQDPTWDYSRWGSYGDFWYHHVYMPAQNPGDAGGMSAYGRWMYGPWFWPPANPPYGPIANPYYNKDANAIPPFSVDKTCDINDPATWQYQTDPFCEPALIPGTPNISTGMEQFNDTPMVNGTVYPTVTLQPKSYRLRILNAANDRFWNLQWYVADPSTASKGKNALGQVIGGTEVALNPTELAAAQLDPVVFPTPVQSTATAGPDWIQIGNEGGFLPAPAVVDGQQPTTWITDPTRFDVGNVDLHSLVVAPAERADVIVDFSQFAGKTLILYNDAPAAYPARVPSYDYYTGAPDQSPVGAPTIMPGYGPNTRTIMQVKVVGTPQPAFDLNKLRIAFTHKADGSGVFESSQNPIIVGQAPYNTAYGKAFAANGDCNQDGSTVCDGLARISNQGGELFKFNTLITGTEDTLAVMIEPKALHDEMNAAAFDEFGRMTANIGLEVVPASPALQNIVLYPYINPQTELWDGTNLPNTLNVLPISVADDGTQIWKITHNGVDTHPMHVHLYDLQVLNRVTWDNIIIPTEPGELGWKETIRVSPLEDVIVAIRPVLPVLPWELPNSIRLLNPMTPPGSTMGFNCVDAAGNPVGGAFVPPATCAAPPNSGITNQLVNYGWEYVWHCHILSHEEMDMMRPQSLVYPPLAPTALTGSCNGSPGDVVNLEWTDNSINETSFVVQKSLDGITWDFLASVESPLADPNTHGQRQLNNQASNPCEARYRVFARNTAGYGGAFMSLSADSTPVSTSIGGAVPNAPSNLGAAAGAGPKVTLNWTDNAADETGFIIERALNSGAWVQIATTLANVTTYDDTTVVGGASDASPDNNYQYRVAAFNALQMSGYATSNNVVVTKFPTAPANVRIQWSNSTDGNIIWTDASTNETGFQLQTSPTGNDPWSNSGGLLPPGTQSAPLPPQPRPNFYRVLAVNVTGTTASEVVGLITPPVAPTPVTVARNNSFQATLAWTDASNNETSFQVQTSINNGLTWSNTNAAIGRTAAQTTAVGDSLTSTLAVNDRTNSLYRVVATNANGSSPSISVGLDNTVAPADPGAPTVNCVRTGTSSFASCTVTWTDLSNNNSSFQVQRANNPGFTSPVNNSGILGGNALTTTFTWLSRTSNWYFRVRAVNNSISRYSNWVVAQPSPFPQPIN